MISEINKVIEKIGIDEECFANEALESSQLRQDGELKKDKKLLDKHNKRITELDRLFTRLYEDNVSEKYPMGVLRCCPRPTKLNSRR